MNSFSKSAVIALRNEIDAALAAIGQKHNLAISLGNARFSPTECRFAKITLIPKTSAYSPANVASGNGVAHLSNTVAGREYINLAYSFALPKDGLGKQFVTSTGTYTITGLVARRKKYPVLAISSTGRLFKFSAQSVRNGIVL